MNWKMPAIVAAALLAGGGGSTALACPFCPPISQSLCEQISTNDVAVLVELIVHVPRPSDAPPPTTDEAIEAGKSTFRVLKVYRGDQYAKVGDTIKATYPGKAPVGTRFLMASLVENQVPQWILPKELTPRSLDYMEKLLALPPKGIERLDFCEDYLEDSETLLQEDSLNEYAMADYPVVRQLQGKLDRDRLLKWIQDPATPETRRRLYFTLLGVCGNAQDAPLLESIIRDGVALEKEAAQIQAVRDGIRNAEKVVQVTDARKLLTDADTQLSKALEAIRVQQAGKLRGLDALIACYLTLGGPGRVAFIEDLFLRPKDGDYTQTYAAIMAIRFHGEENDVVPRQRCIEALRLMLDRPTLADLVIFDLARWEDWENIDKLTELFKNATKEWNYVRVPIINYLRDCPRPEAKAKLEELAKFDPASFKRALSYHPFGAKASEKKPAATAPQPAPKGETKPVGAQPQNDKSSAVERKRVPSHVLAMVPSRTGTWAAIQGTTTSADATPEPADETAATTEEATAEQATAEQAADAAKGATTPTPLLSSRSLTLLVGGVPLAGAIALFGILWAVLRFPRQKYADSTETQP